MCSFFLIKIEIVCRSLLVCMMISCAGVSAVCGNCSHGSVRLVNGATANQGRLEVCIGQSWGTVCQEGFDVNDAKVVCHQLGYDVDLPVPGMLS